MESDRTDAASFQYTVTVDAEGLEAAGRDFLQALRLQSRRLEDAQNRILSREKAYWVLRILCPPVAVLAAAVAYQRGDSTPYVFIWPALAVVFGGLAVAFWCFSFDRAQARLHRWTDRIHQSRVQKLIRRTNPLVPFKVSYEVLPESVRIHVDRTSQDVVIRRGRFRLSIRSGRCYLLFRRSLSPVWRRVLYVDTSEQSEAVEEFLETVAIPTERVADCS